MRAPILTALLCCLAAPAFAAGPGQLDAELLRLAHEAQGVQKIRIYTSPSGKVRKIALYHRDASRIPKPVLALAKETFGDAKAAYYESEHYADLGRVYEVEVDTPGGEKELAATADGKLVYIETTMKPGALPKAVSQAALAATGGGTIVEGEHKKGPRVDQYAVKVKKGERVHYLRISPKGQVVTHGLRIPAQVEVLLKGE